MKLIDAVEKILAEDPRTRDPKYAWLYFTKVLREMGFEIFVKFDPLMPSPETLFRERRHVLNKKNLYSKNFFPEDGVTYESPGKKS